MTGHYNIYHRKDGRYEGRISKGKSKSGKRRFQYVFGRSKEDVQEKISCILEKEISTGHCLKTISEIFDEWYQAIKHRVKESTAANYAMKAQKHILPVFGTAVFDDITSSDIYVFIEQKQEKGLSNRYVSDIITLMKSIFKYASGKYHISDPMNGITMHKKKYAEIRLLDQSEQKKLPEYISHDPNHTTLGIALAMSTGIRIGELAALQWEDVDLEKRILTVRKTIQRIQCSDENKKTKIIITEPKSESSRRSIPIPECVMDFLKRLKGNDREFILSGSEKPIEPRTMQYRFSKVLKNVKLPSVHFHSLRHNFASNCVKLGFDIKALSEILGHNSVEITLNRYVHSDFQQKFEYMNRVKIDI
ncbi:site-specific integrase [Huintestinicola sp.]|uniref:site-specific integrase n=1 Tax=Huintestinicola sp. TaxID=2981661 RepID=UPI003D7E7A49